MIGRDVKHDLRMIFDRLRHVCSREHLRQHMMLWRLFRNIRVAGEATCSCGWTFRRP